MNYDIFVSSQVYIKADPAVHDKIIAEFENSLVGCGRISMWTSHRHPRIWVDLNTDEDSLFDEDMVQLSSWLKRNFNLDLHGYWVTEVDGERFRSEIVDGEVDETSVAWLETDLTVAQIRELQRMAYLRFPKEQD